MARVYNFGAGPAVLPEPVLEQASREMLDWHYLPAGRTPREFWSRSPQAVNVFPTFRTCQNKLDRTFDRLTSLDHVLRDDVGYHVIAALDLFEVAWIASVNGKNWFDWRGLYNQSLGDGFGWLLPLVDQPYVPEYRESCVAFVDGRKGGKSWMNQPEDTVRALACASLAYPARFGSYRNREVDKLFKHCVLAYVTSAGSGPRSRPPREEHEGVMLPWENATEVDTR